MRHRGGDSMLSVMVALGLLALGVVLPTPAAESAPRSPLSTEVTVGSVVMFESVNYPGYFLRHRDGLIDLTRLDPAEQSAAMFRVVAGLADPNWISLEAVDQPGFFLRHQGFRLKLHARENSQLYRDDATFEPTSGLADPAGTSLRSKNYSDRYVRHRDFHGYLESGADALFRRDATFHVRLSAGPGEPQPGTATLTIGAVMMFESVNYPGYFLRHHDGMIELTRVDGTSLEAAMFNVVAGLADAGRISLESTNLPGFFVRHQNFRLKLHARENHQLYRDDATFDALPGLADANGVSLRSVNYPDRFVRHRDFHGYLELGTDDLFRRDATFLARPVP